MPPREKEIEQWFLDIRKCLTDEHEQRQRKATAARNASVKVSAKTEYRRRVAPTGTMLLRKQICDFLALGHDAVPTGPETHTLIYLDVDGVLNVGVRDPGCSGVLLCDVNVHLARSLSADLQQHSLPTGLHANIERLRSVLKRKPRHGDGPYVDYACSHGAEYCERLVQRLAFIIAVAGPKVEVILSSAWRFPSQQRRMHLLERTISKYMGQQFSFKRHTPLRDDIKGVERLQTIGDHLATLGHEALTGTGLEDAPAPSLRVLVLDDFDSTSFQGGKMDIGEEKIRSPEDAAEYLRQRYTAGTTCSNVQCAVVHTFDEWTISDQLNVQMGTGLTLERVCEAAQFLGHKCPDCWERFQRSKSVEPGAAGG